MPAIDRVVQNPTTAHHSTSRRSITHTHSSRRSVHGSRHRHGGVPAAAWRGTVRAVASGPTPDAAWALLGDFCSLDRWVSTVRTCRRVEEEAGCVRYCEGPVNMAMAAPGVAAVGWSKERLLEMDGAGRWYSYEVVESNKGFGRYRATVRVEHDPAGCAVAWSFEADPVQGWTQEGFVEFLEKLARGVARRLEEEINVDVKAEGA